MQRIESTFHDPARTSRLPDWSPSGQLPLENLRYDTVEAVKEQWISYLKILCYYKEIAQPPTDDQIRAFTQYLVDNQNLEARGYKGCWNLIPVGSTSDEEVEYIFVTSYIALAFLVIVKREFHHITRSVEGFNKALDFAFFFATKRHFRGTGYDSDQYLLKAVDILALSGTFTHALTYQKRYWHFLRAMEKAKQRIHDNIKSPASWSSVDVGDAYSALDLLDGADSDFDVVKQIAYRDWYTRRGTPFTADVAYEISQLVYDRIQDELMQSMLTVMDVIAEELVELAPKYVVFECHQRPIETTSYLLDIQCKVKEVSRLLESYKTYMSDKWFQEHFDEIILSIGREIERELLVQVRDMLVVDDERSFQVSISEINIKDHGEIEFWVSGKAF